MKKLVIVRHGIESRDDVMRSDAENPLAPRGRRETATAVGQFVSLGNRADAIVASYARRSLDTAEIWKKALKVPDERLRVETDIYEAERSDILRIVRQLDDANDTVVLIGHNPGVIELLHHLVGRGVERMTPSSFAVISLETDSWSRISLQGTELVHYYAPPPAATDQSLWQRLAFWRR